MSIIVYVLAEPHFDVEQIERFLKHHGLTWRRSARASEPEELVEIAGRMCYMSFGERQSPKSNDEYIRHLIQSGHESVLEHAAWTILLEGVSRSFTHQLVRHRVGFAFSQLSQQYHDESKADFVPPPLLEASPNAREAWNRAVEVARESYAEIVDAISRDLPEPITNESSRETARALRSIARSVLPNATETKIVITANARAIRHFLRVRGAIIGDLEMRIVSAEILKVLALRAPSLFADFAVEEWHDGYPIVRQVAYANPPQ